MRKILALLLLVMVQNLQAQVTSFTIDSSKLNRPLMSYLDSIYYEDQNCRHIWGSFIKNKAPKDEIDSVRKIVKKVDQSNQLRIDSIIRLYGWLSPQEVGFQASQGLFLVVQHAPLDYQKKYYPLIKRAEQDGKILSSNLAILEDRIAMREGRKQTYGSQGFKDNQTGIQHIYPVIDPDNIDARRKSMGLVPMKEYAKLLNVEWNIDDYKKKLPELEQIVRRQRAE